MATLHPLLLRKYLRRSCQNRVKIVSVPKLGDLQKKKRGPHKNQVKLGRFSTSIRYIDYQATDRHDKVIHLFDIRSYAFQYTFLNVLRRDREGFKKQLLKLPSVYCLFNPSSVTVNTRR